MSALLHTLKQTDIFDLLTIEQLEAISKICVERVYQTGDVIFSEGTHSAELYIIAEGEVDILINPSLVSTLSEEKLVPFTIATLRRGQSFGEIALVDRGMRSATTRAAQHNTRLYLISSEQIIALCEEDPRMGYRLMYNLAADLAMKIRNADLRLRDASLYR